MGSVIENSIETKAIMSRFFQAVHELKTLKRIRGVKTYCDLAGIDRRNFHAQEKDLDRRYFQMSWMLPLISEFKISSDWLLIGKGEMFKKKQPSLSSLA